MKIKIHKSKLLQSIPYLFVLITISTAILGVYLKYNREYILPDEFNQAVEKRRYYYNMAMDYYEIKDYDSFMIYADSSTYYYLKMWDIH